MVSYSKLNYKSISGILGICVMIIFITLNILILFQNSKAPLYGIIAMTIANIVVICSFIYDYTTRLLITNDSVTHVTIFKQKTIKWKDIKSYGIYVDIRRNRYILEKIDYNDFFFDYKFIYVTDINDFTIDKYKIRHKNNSVFIDFSYRKEAIELILQKMAYFENIN